MLPERRAERKGGGPQRREGRPATGSGRTEHGKGRTRAAAKRQVERCLAFIHQHYAHDFPVEALSGLVSVSPSYLFRIFRRRTGMTPVHYRNQVRVERAKHLLLDGTLGLEEIAGRVGFDDARYFARVFKKQTGASPSEFRRRALAR